MSRKTHDVVEDELPSVTTAPAPGPDDIDPHGFWDRAKLDAEDNDDAFAVVMESDVDAEQDSGDDRETRAAMGKVTEIQADERTVLADWAESKACRVCRRKISQSHDPSTLKHDECRTALRVARLIRRYH